MKDMEARERLDKLELLGSMDAVEGRLDKLEEDFEEEVNCGLRNLIIDECPKCKHETLVKRTKPFISIWRLTAPPPTNYTCLSCGTEWEMANKSVKKIIKKKKGRGL